MANYSANFAKFQQGIASQLQQGRQGMIKAMSDLGRVQAAKNQAALKQKADIRNTIAEDVRDLDATDMWDWQASSAKNQIMETGKLWESGEINGLEYASMLADLDANITSQKTAYRTEVGNAETSKPTESTYYGQLKAIDEWVQKGVNVHADNHVIIEGLDQGDQGVANAQIALNDRFEVRNRGKSPDAQILKSYYNADRKWTYLVGNPDNPSAAKEVLAKDFMANNEGENAFLLPFTNLTRIMSDYAVEDRVENFIQDGGDREMAQWFNGELMRNKAFRKDVFSQFGGTIFDQGEAKIMGDVFSSMEGLGMRYDSENNKVVFDPENPHATFMEKMVDNARNNFVKEYKARHQDPDPTSTSDKDKINFNKLAKEEFDPNMAFVEIMNLSGSGGRPVLNVKRGDLDLIKPIGLTALPKVMYTSNTGDAVSGVAMIPYGNEAGKIVALKVKQTTKDVIDPTLSPEVVAQYQQSGIPVPTVQVTQDEPYYTVLNAEETNNAFRNLGEAMGYKENLEQAGEEYLYKKYISKEIR